MLTHNGRRLKIAVVGSGISGLSAAWLLSQRHDVTVFEKDGRIGGHSNTVDVRLDGRDFPVDTGFIVYNEKAYPNLTALFDHLRVPTQASNMSFAVSLDRGRIEYSGSNLRGLFAQKKNLLRPRFWQMLLDIRRFYSNAPRDLACGACAGMTLGSYLASGGYGASFRDDHLLPMAAAIWSASPEAILDYPASAFIQFHDNHGLLQLNGRPQWRTVSGGSRKYVELLTRSFVDRVRTGSPVQHVMRTDNGVVLKCSGEDRQTFDHVVIATHADEALGLISDQTSKERDLLSAFRYSKNKAILHTDPSLMPRRRETWSSWNYIGSSGEEGRGCAVTYWMNLLQDIASPREIFLTLNPNQVDERLICHQQEYTHPLFDQAAILAQQELWSLQGQRNTWFCGAYFGSGFHEDGLQAGLAVAEALGAPRRPWSVADESARIVIRQPSNMLQREAA